MNSAGDGVGATWNLDNAATGAGNGIGAAWDPEEVAARRELERVAMQRYITAGQAAYQGATQLDPAPSSTLAGYASPSSGLFGIGQGADGLDAAGGANKSLNYNLDNLNPNQMDEDRRKWLEELRQLRPKFYRREGLFGSA